MSYEIKQDGKFKFIEEGEGEILMLLHGLFGALSNFRDLIEHFRRTHKVVVPILPLLELDLLHTSVGGLQKFVNRFIEYRSYNNIHLMGNSLGGHVALVHILKNPERIKSLILTGSSGLFENGMGDTYPKRGDKEYIRNNLGEELNQVKQPTCLIWGNNDTITPPFVGKEFQRLIPNSELHFIDKCGHAPMMEVPEEFNRILEGFLAKLKSPAATV